MIISRKNSSKIGPTMFNNPYSSKMHQKSRFENEQYVLESLAAAYSEEYSIRWAKSYGAEEEISALV